jgi:GPH family glycoside/pentoside/hexuronide:cation symporter
MGPNPPYQAFAILFAAFALLATRQMRGAWGNAPIAAAPLADFAVVLRDGPSQRLLMLALVNSAPVAVSATLFLFFVESRLDAPGWEGPLLIAFFLSAAIAAPLWSRLAQRNGTRRMLLWGMSLAIFAFAFAATLGPGDAPAFALVCIASGAALGADLTLLPALFARRMATVAPEGSAGFALWSFAGKFALALAAITVLPFLQSQGFTGPDSPESALVALGLTYALVPCALKLLAIALLATAPESEPAHA